MSIPSPGRDYSLDSLRVLMVLFILLLHAACAYAFGIPWWHAQDLKSQAFDLILVSIDGFALSVLYFIAGAFAAVSLERRGPAGFLAGKFKRLGLPVVFLSALYLPAMVYVGYLRRTENPLSFFDYWLHWMKTAADWGYDQITSMETGAKFADYFAPHHLWFMSLLLVFFAGYVLWRKLAPTKPKTESGSNSITLLIVSFLVMGLGFFAFCLVMPHWTWARIGPFLLFQPARLPVYGMAFVMGVLARPGLSQKRPLPGPIWLWLVLFILCMFVMAAAMGKTQGFMAPAPGAAKSKVILAYLGHGLLRGLLTVSAICLFVNAGRRLLGNPKPWRKSLAASSYDIYILHMPLVVFIQVALLGVTLPLGLKMLLAFALPVALFWGLSRALADRNPLWGLGLLVLFFGGFCLAYG